MPDASSAEQNPGLWCRCKAIWPLKLRTALLLNLVFWTVYLFLSRHAFLPLHEIPLTWVDRWIGFQPHPWTWIYLSEFALTSLVPWLITSREQLRRYVTGLTLLIGTSFLVFILFPTSVPRVDAAESMKLLQGLRRMDGPLNAFPSLHAGCLVFHLLLVRRLFGRNVPIWVMAVLWLWGGLILFSTIAIQQHRLLDLWAGGLLGWLSDRLGWRGTQVQARQD